MSQGDVWKKKRSGLANVLEDRRKTWLDSGDAGTVEARKQGRENEDGPWLQPRSEAASRLSEE